MCPWTNPAMPWQHRGDVIQTGTPALPKIINKRKKKKNKWIKATTHSGKIISVSEATLAVSAASVILTDVADFFEPST